ncbi:hypothetical protein VTO73DRAFT_1054 [Trametes versicolor]
MWSSSLCSTTFSPTPTPPSRAVSARRSLRLLHDNLFVPVVLQSEASVISRTINSEPARTATVGARSIIVVSLQCSRRCTWGICTYNKLDINPSTFNGR